MSDKKDNKLVGQKRQSNNQYYFNLALMIFSNRKEMVRNVHDCLVGYIYTLKKLTTDLPRNGKIMNVCYDNVNSVCFIYINGNKQMQ